MSILVTGGSGYVGSHCVLELLENGHSIVVIDNLVNSVQFKDESLPESLRRVQQITNKKIEQFYNGSIDNDELLEQVFAKHQIKVVIHFAALKSVGESVSKPLFYYHNNVSGTVKLLSAMERFGVNKFIFSSSATVYGIPEYLPVDESHPTGQTCSNPYGKSKFVVEMILEDLCKANDKWTAISLRYFNPIGAHESGLIGEDPNQIPNNLMPYVTQVASGLRPFLRIFGNDYETRDGTGERDYIHISDLSSGHMAALNKIMKEPETWLGYSPINLGTGAGTTVLELVTAFEKTTGVKIPYKFVERRPGDIAAVSADAKLAASKLGWKTQYNIDDMCRSAWNWQSKNPTGYRTK